MKKITTIFKISLLLGSTVPTLVQVDAHADTVTDPINEVRITDDMPKSGGVVLDDDGKVIGTTDPSLTAESPIESRGSVHIYRGHWTYGTHNWPKVAWGTKQAWSNFNHYDYYHYATAVVGNNRRTVYARANKYAYAIVTGESKHTGLAYYGW
ncbi:MULTISPECIES: lactococcin 972 family bacteriocin [unclassified Enterococcus]|uniref:lactococcin 972 family bacteriocin n=1 Tax=unclassified Enterococcus TaxID=2608891 RepID=UPI001F14B107|nr:MULTISPECIES: lactococcin 972 family bacteriocin [unclassified Enterococcus]